jgi:hypothetical protein
VLEQAVEGGDRPGEQGAVPADQITFDVIDVSAVRNDQPRIFVDRVEKSLQQKRDLAGMRRPDDERETQAGIVVSGRQALSYGSRKLRDFRRATSACDRVALPPLPASLLHRSHIDQLAWPLAARR